MGSEFRVQSSELILFCRDAFHDSDLKRSSVRCTDSHECFSDAREVSRAYSDSSSLTRRRDTAETIIRCETARRNARDVRANDIDKSFVASSECCYLRNRDFAHDRLVSSSLRVHDRADHFASAILNFISRFRAKRTARSAATCTRRDSDRFVEKRHRVRFRDRLVECLVDTTDRFRR